MTTNRALENLLKARAIAKKERERKQLQLLAPEADYASTIVRKLDGLAAGAQYWNFMRCGNEEIFRTCESCGDVQRFDYRCSLKWCPRCQWWISERRKKVLQFWVAKIRQPKHLVLTQKNFPILTGKKIREHTRNLARMRKKKCFQDVKGGSVSVEITHSSEGWHLHSHWLIDCRWLDMHAVSRAWGKLVGQEFAICKIKDVRGREYIQEITKYVATGTELASWPGELIWEFIRAVRGRRFFFPFGSLFHLGPEIRRELRLQQPNTTTCECGCSDFIFEDQTHAILHEVQKMERARRRR